MEAVAITICMTTPMTVFALVPEIAHTIAAVTTVDLIQTLVLVQPLDVEVVTAMVNLLTVIAIQVISLVVTIIPFVEDLDQDMNLIQTLVLVQPLVVEVVTATVNLLTVIATPVPLPSVPTSFTLVLHLITPVVHATATAALFLDL